MTKSPVVSACVESAGGGLCSAGLVDFGVDSFNQSSLSLMPLRFFPEASGKFGSKPLTGFRAIRRGLLRRRDFRLILV